MNRGSWMDNAKMKEKMLDKRGEREEVEERGERGG